MGEQMELTGRDDLARKDGGSYDDLMIYEEYVYIH